MRFLEHTSFLMITGATLAMLAPSAAHGGTRTLNIDAEYNGNTTLTSWRPNRTPDVTVNREDSLGSAGSRRTEGAGFELESSWFKLSGFGSDSDVSNTASIRHMNSVEAANRSDTSLVYGQVLTQTSLTLHIQEPIFLDVHAVWSGSSIAGTGRTQQSGSLSVLGLLDSGVIFEQAEFMETGTDEVAWLFEITSPTSLTFDIEIGAFIEAGSDPSDLSSIAELDLGFNARPIPAPSTMTAVLPGLLLCARRRRKSIA